jgi:hypothetical protein
MLAAVALASLALCAPEQAQIALLPALSGASPHVTDAATLEATLLESLELRPGLVALGSEALFVLGGDIQRRAADCGSDEACTCAVLADFGVEYALLGLISVEATESLIDLRLLRTRDARRIGQTSSLVSSSRRGLAEGLLTHADRLLLEAGFPQVALLEVEATPHDARIQVSQGVRVDEGTELNLRPGEYSVLVSAPGYTSRAQSVVLNAGQRHRLKVTLQAESRPFHTQPWFWVGVGALALGAAITSAVVVTAPGPDCFCVTSQTDACMGCP